MRTFKHVTPRYVVDRTRLYFQQKEHPEHPWLTSAAIGILESALLDTDVGAEFGSGRSTAWFVQRIGKLYSVEHNPEWHAIVERQSTAAIDSGKLDYKLCETEADYVGQIARFDDESLDFCLVDGVWRDRCALEVLPKMKKGSLLVIDNANSYLPDDATRAPNSRRWADGATSETWTRFIEATRDWREIRTSNGVFDTRIWIRAR
ncbi:class I SAM-dependent methyltransferase [Sphingopyxis sp. H115]|uniref:class I SAM-dependent methyltransferase n=1 Tax=Sphingopyxis sp. H115 TaxID=1759073 RepID=UPI000736BC28|nr:class I SAM-dependent methyltransferase [Sphingopyxis sp. H115]KTE17779.1 hypothetical protein ATE71_01390 [Sphingopyxis sp. H115]